MYYYKMRTITIWTSSVLLLLGISVVSGFFEESIFEDEDIYVQALPPVAQTGITAPGTKWCGPGHTAEDYDDLGTQEEADMCCRTHDHCPEILESKKTFRGLNNTDWFPILSCSCEQIFINCLQNVNNMVSNTLGAVYFGGRSKCFALGHPIQSCKEYQQGTFRKRCIRYNVDKQQQQQWQLYDMPFYSISHRTLSRIVLGY